MMTVTLSYDRRAIDEEQAADFLSVLRDVLASPSRMILGSVSASGRARVGV
jgi:pyruvate/2-oxoglutarate dehydrogenase complex dihydrolipoamide acyltransferase (E2) component